MAQCVRAGANRTASRRISDVRRITEKAEPAVFIVFHCDTIVCAKAIYAGKCKYRETSHKSAMSYFDR